MKQLVLVDDTDQEIKTNYFVPDIMARQEYKVKFIDIDNEFYFIFVS